MVRAQGYFEMAKDNAAFFQITQKWKDTIFRARARKDPTPRPPSLRHSRTTHIPKFHNSQPLTSYTIKE
jgi:hypothetical protein